MIERKFKVGDKLPFKIDDSVTITERPYCWSSYLKGNSGLSEVLYPYTFTIKELKVDKYNDLIINDTNGYGWVYHSDIFKSANPFDKFKKGDIISYEFSCNEGKSFTHIIRKLGYYNISIENKYYQNINASYDKDCFYKNFKPATSEEVDHLNQCLKANKYVDYTPKIKNKFKYNRWYKDPNKSGLFFIKTDTTGYGFKHNDGKFFTRTEGDWDKKDLVLATKEEIENKLVSYASERYPIGCTFKHVNSRINSLNKSGVCYNSFHDTVCSNSMYIFKDGIWADIVSEKVDIFKVDEWVVVTERYGANYAKEGDIVKINNIANGGYRVKDSAKKYKYLTNGSFCSNVRKATQEEINSVTKPIDTNVFPKDSYVVLLSSCNGNNVWKYSMPENYVYQLREDSSTLNFYIYIDIKSSTSNGWSTFQNTINNKLKLRAATPFEIRKYKKYNKPYNVNDTKNTSKKEYIKFPKIGTKVKMTECIIGCHGANGKIGMVVNDTEKITSGLYDTDKGFNIRIDDGATWRVNEKYKIMKDINKPKYVVRTWGSGTMTMGRESSKGYFISLENYDKEGGVSKNDIYGRVKDVFQHTPQIPATLEQIKYFEEYGTLTTYKSKSTPKYKIGDELEITSVKDNFSGLNIGDIFTVREVTNDLNIWYRPIKGESSGVREDCVKLHVSKELNSSILPKPKESNIVNTTKYFPKEKITSLEELLEQI